jgi:HK97 gp10 family phage protein
MGMKIEGAHELQAALLALPDKVSKKIMGKALRAGAEVVLGEARYLAPVKTGALAAGLRITMSNKGGEAAAIVSTSPEQYYGNMQEFGTKKMKPHPFLEKALEASQRDATDAIAATLKDGIESEAF